MSGDDLAVDCPVCGAEIPLKPNYNTDGFHGRCGCARVRVFVDDGQKARGMFK